jgi:HEAT repeat protein
MGERARPAARDLCEAATDASESVRQAALEALEKVHPALHKNVLVLLVDDNSSNHIRASRAVAALGKDGAPAVPVLLAHVRWNCSTERDPQRAVFRIRYFDDDMLVADIGALGTVAPDEPAVVNTLVELTRFTDQFGGGYRVRPAAVGALLEVGKAYPGRRKQLVPALVAALDFRVNERHDEATCLAALAALGAFGPDAREALPALKKLKLSPRMTVREAAAVALGRIEKKG